MKLGSRTLISLALCSLCLGVNANISSLSPGYTADFTNGIIYSFDLQTGDYSAVVTIPGVSPNDVALLNSKTAYVIGYNDSNLYAIDLVNRTYRQVTPAPVGPTTNLFAVDVANEGTAYAVGYGNDTVYSINLSNGSFAPVATIPGSGLTDIAIESNTKAYVIGYNTNQVYAVDLQTGTYQIVTSSPIGFPTSPFIEGIGLANNSTAYIAGNGDANLFALDLQTGVSTLVTPVPITGGPPLVNVGIDGNNAYTVNNSGGQIYVVNLTNGAVRVLATISGAVDLAGVGLLLQMPQNGLTGNNLRFSDYLNESAPIDVIRSFALLSSGLEPALESAAPTRNAFATYASQNGYLAFMQTLGDHMRHKRFGHQASDDKKLTWQEISGEDLLVAYEKKDGKISFGNKAADQRNRGCRQTSFYDVWMSPFGEYAKEKAQLQTPAFSMGLGGVAVGFDYNRSGRDVVGCAASYIYTHIHEADNGGHSNVNQGYLAVYGTLHESQWYFDLGLSGGYYYSDNLRKIIFFGVNEKAKSHSKGWQLAPHFEVGYDGFFVQNCSVKWFGFEPFLAADWAANWERGLQESGASSFNMGQKARFCSLFRGETGLRFHETARFNWGSLVFREKASYAYQKMFHTGAITAFLVGSGGSFTVNTLTGSQNLGVFEFSMLYLSANPKMPYLDIRYQGEFGSRYQSHQGVIELGRKF